MKTPPPVGVIYLVGDLKAAFAAKKDELFETSEKAGTKDELKLLLLRQAAAGLGLLSFFNNEDYLALPAIPSEIASATDPMSRPFQDYYVSSQFTLIPNELGLKLEKK